MRCEVWRKDRYLGTVEYAPECGVDFCDRCGDCLSCYRGDPCYLNDDGPHRWVKYLDDCDEEVRAELEALLCALAATPRDTSGVVTSDGASDATQGGKDA